MKMKTARRILLSLLAISLFSVFNASGAFAQGVLTHKSISLSNVSPAVSDTLTIGFTTATAATLTEFDIQFSNQATAGTAPASMTINTGNATVTGAPGTWAVTTPSTALMVIKNTTQVTNINAGAITIVPPSDINPTLADCTENTVNTIVVSSTCYGQIKTIDNTGATDDIGSASFTLINPVTASVTVDPSLTFTIGGLASSTTVDGITTTQAGTYNTLPFGDLVAGASSVVGQSLQVVTNANSGYTVNMSMVQSMTGTNTKKIDPFTPAGSAIWSSPVAWTAPSGTDTSGNATAITGAAAALGANTNDVRVSGWGTPTNVFGSVGVGDTDLVANSSGPDQTTIVDVLYKVQDDVYQPADTYTGTIDYFAVATY